MSTLLYLFLFLFLFLVLDFTSAGSPHLYFTWNVTYGTIYPLGLPQKGILINGQFPGPIINSTTNNVIVINVFNQLDEPFLLSWNGIQQRKNCWQDGMAGTNCPILPSTNFTYKFQVKDQIGSFFYFPSLGMHKAAGGFGGLHVHSRHLIPVPYDTPTDDYTVLIGDWYSKTHTTLKRILDNGRCLGRPNGVIINGNNGVDLQPPLFTMEANKTYRYRICNVGLKASLNFRIQGHLMKLVEMDGSHTVQNIYDSIDVHVGQCYAVLVTADQTPADYYMVASTRFTRYDLRATAVIRYHNSDLPPSPVLPVAPKGWHWSLNQWRTFRWNLTASAARPNPQGSFHYGRINITRSIKLRNSVGVVDGKLRYSINGKSHVDTRTPLKLLEYFGVPEEEFKYDTIDDVPPTTKKPIVLEPIVVKAVFRDFVEIILENPERSLQSYHIHGYSFFSVGMGSGEWTPSCRSRYNLLDAVSRHTVQVYPRSWAAILLTFDNAGMWKLGSQIWDRSYLGQQVYFSVTSPARSLRDEYSLPDTALLCGRVTNLPKPPPYT